MISDQYNVVVSDATIFSCIRNINFEFINATEKIVLFENPVIKFDLNFYDFLKNELFKKYLIDLLDYSTYIYNQKFSNEKYVSGFILHAKYSRKDVCRILNWDKDEQSTIYGYKIKHGTCPIFVTYHKEDSIVKSTMYADKFISNEEFEWMSRSRRTLNSNEIIKILSSENNLRIPLFIKKSNDEGNDFFFMGDLTPKASFQTYMPDDNGKSLPVVKIHFNISHPVDDSLFEYLTANGK
jgi:hypothetical protein